MIREIVQNVFKQLNKNADNFEDRDITIRIPINVGVNTTESRHVDPAIMENVVYKTSNANTEYVEIVLSKKE